MPVESAGGVRNVTPNTLFSSGEITLITWAPDFLWLKLVVQISRLGRMV